MSVGMLLEGATVASLSDSNDVRGRVKLEAVFNKIWGSGVN